MTRKEQIAFLRRVQVLAGGVERVASESVQQITLADVADVVARAKELDREVGPALENLRFGPYYRGELPVALHNARDEYGTYWIVVGLDGDGEDDGPVVLNRHEWPRKREEALEWVRNNGMRLATPEPDEAPVAVDATSHAGNGGEVA